MTQQKPEPSTKAMVATATGIAALVGFVGWLAVMDASESAPSTCGDKAGAWGWAKAAVQERLKAPSTAEFPWFDEGYVSTDGECGYVVAAHVDAENSFGAQIRSRFVVALDYDAEIERYRVASVAIK